MAALALTLLAAAVRAPAQLIHLEDVIAGGDGYRNAPPDNVGIDPRTGLFSSLLITTPISSAGGPIPVPVPESPYIDSVFLLKGRVPSAQDGCNGCYVQYVTRSGVQLWLADAQESNLARGIILKNHNGGTAAPSIQVGESNVARMSAIGMAPSMGVTFDLDAPRERHGPEAVGCFSALLGFGPCAGGSVHFIAMLSNDAAGAIDVRHSTVTHPNSELVAMPIPAEARYLTLVTVAVTQLGCEGAAFARPVITPAGCPGPSPGWIEVMWPWRLPPGGEAVFLQGENLDPDAIDQLGGGCSVVRLGSAEFTNHLRQITRIKALAPPMAPGRYVLTIDNGCTPGDVFASLPGTIEVALPPLIASVSPSTLAPEVGTRVTIRGQNLRRDMRVLVDPGLPTSTPIELTDTTFVSETQIDGTFPPVQGSLVDLGAATIVLVDQTRTFHFPGLVAYSAVGLDAVSPDVVPPQGGTELVISGRGFDASSRIRVGGLPLVDARFLDGEHIAGRCPPLAPGIHGLELLDSRGAVVARAVEAIQARVPTATTIRGVSPDRISTRGGDVIRIVTGSWHGDAAPFLGGAPLINIDASAPESLAGEAPPLPAGAHDVELRARDGRVLARLAGAVVAAEPTGVRLTGVAPLEVLTGGDTPVVFTGTGFHSGMTPLLGGLPLRRVEVLDAGHLRGLSPPLPEGPHAAAIQDGRSALARIEAAVTALPFLLPGDPDELVLSRLAASRFATGTDRLSIAATGMPEGAVLRVGGIPVLEAEPSSPCAVGSGAGRPGGQGGGGGVVGGGGPAVFEGLVPELPPGHYVVDFYMPGEGVVATLEDAIEVVSTNAAPVVSRVIGEDVPREGGARLHVFGSFFGPGTSVLVGGAPLAGARLVSSRLIVGQAPPLAAGDEAGPRDVDILDSRGTSTLVGAVVYVDPAPAGVRFVRGDANASGTVDLSDAVAILGYLFLGSPSRFQCLESADTNLTGTVDLSDAVQLLGYLFLGRTAPAAPYPECGLATAAPSAGLGCEGFTPCGGGGGGGVAAGGLRPNVHVLAETRTRPGEPILRDLSPVAGQVIVDDPPGGLDLKPGDIIAGFVPVTSEAIHSGVTYLVELGLEQAPSCLEKSAQDRTYGATNALFSDVFENYQIQQRFPPALGDIRFTGEAIAALGNVQCLLDEQAGGAAGGAGGAFDPLISFELPPFALFRWEDGPNHAEVGFHKLRVKYAASEASLGLDVSFGGVKSLSYFSGVLLDADVVAYVDSHLEKHIHEEKELLTYRKDHVIFVYGVPIHFVASGRLVAGVDVEAHVNMYLDAGAHAYFKAGAGLTFDGSRITNETEIDFPVLEPIEGTPNFDLNGAIVAKAYLRPEARLFAGIFFKGLTAALTLRTEAYTRFHASGATSPVPCFQWGVDAGMKASFNAEIQFLGTDWFDRTVDAVDVEELNLIGGEYGCKIPPIARVSYQVTSLGGSRYEVRLDASASQDPDGGPLRFRWDFNDDGQCDRATLYDPRTTVIIEHFCPPSEVNSICRTSREMRVRVTDDENVSVERRFRVYLTKP